MASQNFFVTDPQWIARYPGAKAGILVMKNIDSSTQSENFGKVRIDTEKAIKEQYKNFSREQLNVLPVIDAYNRYYKRFNGKTYHVRSQVESVASGKPLSSALPVITAMFMAEVKNMFLTAGHDLDTLDLPVRITIGNAETFTDIRGSEKKTEAGDMVMVDGKGVISSIILGPDSRTKLTQQAKNSMFATYAPSEILKEHILAHLEDIQRYIRLFSPEATTELIEVFEAK